ASACCAGGTRFKPRCTANSLIGCPLTVATLPVGITAGLAATAGVLPTSCAATGRQAIASVSTIPQEPRMDFLLVPEKWVEGRAWARGLRQKAGAIVATEPTCAEANLIRGGGAV